VTTIKNNLIMENLIDKIYADIVRENKDMHLEVVSHLGVKAQYALKHFRETIEDFLTPILKVNGGCVEISEMDLSHLGSVNRVYLEDNGNIRIEGNLNVVGDCLLDDVANPIELLRVVEEVYSKTKTSVK
jgi:hypothetical protein